MGPHIKHRDVTSDQKCECGVSPSTCPHHGLFYSSNSVVSQKSETANARLEALELAASYAQDIVDNWETLSIRQLSVMTGRIKSLKEALELVQHSG